MSDEPKKPEFRLDFESRDVQRFDAYLEKLFHEEGNLTFPIKLFERELIGNYQRIQGANSHWEDIFEEDTAIRSQLQSIKECHDTLDVEGTLMYGVPGLLFNNREIVGEDEVRNVLFGEEADNRRLSYYRALSAIKALLLEAMAAYTTREREEISDYVEDFQYVHTEELDLETALHAKMPDPITPFTMSGYGGRSRHGGREKFAVFISHAGEDKQALAVPVHLAMASRGLSSFLDETGLRPGDDAPASMLHAMEDAHVAVVILSPEFGGKKWTILELKRFLERRRGDKLPCILLPVFYRITRDECKTFTRYIEDNEEVFEKLWFYDRVNRGESSVEHVAELMREVAEIDGIECHGEVGEDIEALVGRICEGVVGGAIAFKEKHEAHIEKLRTMEEQCKEVIRENEAMIKSMRKHIGAIEAMVRSDEAKIRSNEEIIISLDACLRSSEEE